MDKIRFFKRICDQMWLRNRIALKRMKDLDFRLVMNYTGGFFYFSLKSILNNNLNFFHACMFFALQTF